MRNTIVLIVIVLLITSCKNTNKTSDFSQAQIDEFQSSHPGKQLMESLCYTCHAVNVDHENRLAPPMKAIQKHYLSNDISKEEFTNDLVTWVGNPDEEDARMYGAVNRFGVMPKLNFQKKDLEQIADYLYKYNVDSPHGDRGHHGGRGHMDGDF